MLAFVVVFRGVPRPSPKGSAGAGDVAATTTEAKTRGADDELARSFMSRAASRMGTPPRDVNAEAAARLAGFQTHGGILEFLRIATLRMAAADAVEADRWIDAEALSAVLARSGATAEDVAHAVSRYPVERFHGEPVDELRWAYPRTEAHRVLADKMLDAMGRAGVTPPTEPRRLDGVIAEGLRCGWMAAHSAWVLGSFAESLEEVFRHGGGNGFGEEFMALRRQGRHALRWCAEYCADRLVVVHGMDPAEALRVAMEFARGWDEPLGLPEDLFPPRYVP
jgi:hypothetical protein